MKSNISVISEKLSSKRAVTLAEMLLASAILSFVLGALLMVFINCIFLNDANRNLTTAMTHAEFVMEQIKDRSLSNLVNFQNLPNDINTINMWDWNAATIAGNGLNALPGEAINSALAVITPNTLYDVTVTVNWQDRGVRARNTVLRTWFAF